MVTRFYLPSSGSPPASITPSSDWHQTTGYVSHPAVTAKTNTGRNDLVLGESVAIGQSFLFAQFVSDVLPTKTITGDVHGAIIVSQGASSRDFCSQVHIRVVKPDGSDRGTLLAFNNAALSSEWGTGFARLLFPRAGVVSVSSVAAVAGDRIVIEVGALAYNTNTASSLTGTMRFSDIVANGDLAHSIAADTSDNSPWIEFSDDVFSAPALPEGPLTATLPTLAGDLAGTYGPSGTIAGTLPTLAGDLAGAYGPTGDIAATLPTLAGALDGSFAPPGVSGDILGALPTLSGDLASTYADTAALDGTLPALTGDLAGVLPVDGTLDGALAALTGSLTGAFDSGEENPYETLVLADNPLWYFRLNEPTGTLANSAPGSAATLTKVGTVDQGEPGAAPFLGLGVGVDGPAGNTLLVENSSTDSRYLFTVEFWYQGTDTDAVIVSSVNTPDDQRFIVGVGTAPNADEAGLDGAPYIVVAYGSHVRGIRATSLTINDGLPHHISASFGSAPFAVINSGTFELFVDGVSPADDSVSDGFAGDLYAPLGLAAGEWSFGASVLGIDGATGVLDELALYPTDFNIGVNRIFDRYDASGAAPYGTLGGTLPALTGALTGAPTPVLPALTGAFEGVFSHPVETGTADSSNGRNRTGYALMTVTYPLAATPVTVQPIRVLVQSVPEQVMSGGQPV